MREIIVDGFKIFLKNPIILLLVFTGLILVYFLLLGALLSIIPPEKVIEMANNDPEKIVEDLQSTLAEDMEKTLISLFVFGTVGFVVMEFFIAGVVGLALDLNTCKKIGLSDFLNKGFIFTPRMVFLEILMTVALISIIFPISLLYYLSKSPLIEFIESSAIFLLSIVLMPARFLLISENLGVFDSFTQGVRFGIQNFVWIAVIVIISSTIILPAVFFHPAIIALVPVAFSLSTIWFAGFYLSVKNYSKILSTSHFESNFFKSS
jgi:hypothetical protein